MEEGWRRTVGERRGKGREAETTSGAARRRTGPAPGERAHPAMRGCVTDARQGPDPVARRPARHKRMRDARPSMIGAGATRSVGPEQGTVRRLGERWAVAVASRQGAGGGACETSGKHVETEGGHRRGGRGGRRLGTGLGRDQPRTGCRGPEREGRKGKALSEMRQRGSERCGRRCLGCPDRGKAGRPGAGCGSFAGACAAAQLAVQDDPRGSGQVKAMSVAGDPGADGPRSDSRNVEALGAQARPGEARE